MEINIKGHDISYSVNGDGHDLILLHGWGANKEIFKPLIEELSEDYRVYAIDLPGFGQSEIKYALTLSDYVDILGSLIKELQIEEPIILGHSFGGRIAIKYASENEIKKLILVSTPGIKHVKFIAKIKIYLFKICKKLKINLNTGSKDYKAANSFLKTTLVNVVNEDLFDCLSQINADTLIIWGAKDKDVSLKIAKEMNIKIRKSGLIVIPNARHYPFMDRFRYFLIVLKAFLLSDDK